MVAEAVELEQMRIDGRDAGDGLEQAQVGSPELNDANAAKAEGNVKERERQAEERDDHADVGGGGGGGGGEGESGGQEGLHSGEIVHAGVQDVVFVVQALENLVPGKFWVGEIGVEDGHGVGSPWSDCGNCTTNTAVASVWWRVEERDGEPYSAWLRTLRKNVENINRK